MTNFELTTAAGDAVREKYRREGAVQERERIIKLLEDEQYHAIVTEPVEIGSGNEPTTSHWATCEACRFIALIKGENK